MLTRRQLLQLTAAAAAAAGLPRPARAAPPWVPLALGARWTYTTTQSLALAPDGDGPAPLHQELPGDRSTETVTALSRDGDVLVAVIEERWETTGVVSTSHRRVGPDGFLPDIGPLESPAGPVTTSDARGLVLPTEPVEGDRWTYAVTYESPVSRMELRAQRRCLGVEVVPTPAGRFEALRVQESVTVRLIPTGGLPASQHVQEDDLYYARGVGLVLSLTDNGAGYAAMRALTAYTAG